MERKVALVGVLLVVVGIVGQFAWYPIPPGPGSSPADTLANHLVFFAQLLGQVVVTVGAVMLALALFIRVTGGHPLASGGRPLLLAGVAIVVLTAAASYFLQTSPAVYGVIGELPVKVFLGLMAVLNFAQVTGGAVLGVWLAGLLGSPKAPRPRAEADPHLAPGRPF